MFVQDKRGFLGFGAVPVRFEPRGCRGCSRLPKDNGQCCEMPSIQAATCGVDGEGQWPVFPSRMRLQPAKTCKTITMS